MTYSSSTTIIETRKVISMSFTLNPHVTWVDEDDEIRLYHAEYNQFQSLNETGALIWRLILEGCDETTIIDRIVTQYQPLTDDLHQQITQDIQAYLEELCASQLLQRSNNPSLDTIPPSVVSDVAHTGGIDHPDLV